MEIFSTERGDGAPVVLLHPFPLSPSFWDGLDPPPGIRLILPGFPGFGGEAVEGLETTLNSLAQSLFFHLEKLDVVQPVRLLGISMGGYWAFEFIRQFPGRVEALMLVSTRPGNDRPEARQKRLEMAARVQREGVGRLPEALLPGLLGKTNRSEKPELVKRLEDGIRKAPPAAVALAQRTMAARADLTATLGSIRARTWILAGREDTLIPVSEAEAMARAIQGARLEIFEDCGHLIPWEAPDKFRTIWDQWLTHPGS